VLAHGEFYNLPELRRELKADDLPIPRLLALAHRRWGVDLSRHLNGLYALAVLEHDGIRLFRDASGARSLFYASPAPGRFAVATRLESLLRLPGMARRLAPKGLYEYLRFLDIAAPNTLYQDVFALEAGHMLTWQPDQGVSVDAVKPQAPDSLPASFDAAVDTLEGLLRQGVARRLEDATRPAAFLSGGVDSALLCAIGARECAELRAVTVGFPGEHFDESPTASAIARHLDLPHMVLRYERGDLLDAFAAFQRGAEQPVGDPTAPATLLAFKDCQARFDAALDGSGADESLGLMPPRHVRIATEYGALLPAWLRCAGKAALAGLPGLKGYAPILDFSHPAELMIRWHGFTQEDIAALVGGHVDLQGTRFYQTYSRFPRQAHFERYTALLDVMPGDRLHDGARLSGLTLRFPYLDPEVDGFIRALPTAWRYQEDQPKRLLRALLARHVPRELWDTPKRGFDFPLLAFLRDDGHALVKRYLLKSIWRDQGVLSPVAVEDYAQRFMAGEDRLKFRIWALAVLAAWLEDHEWQ
jgi:asparagine synthase (glutamine-hydrolysing)